MTPSVEYWYDQMVNPDVSPEDASFAYEAMLEALDHPAEPDNDQAARMAVEGHAA